MKSFAFSLLTVFLGLPAATQAQPYAYVSSVAGNVIQVVSTTTGANAASIPVPPGPTGLALTPDGARLYVASQGANSVSVISTASNTLTNTIGVGATPIALAISPDGAQVYVVNKGSNSISVINIASQSVVSTIPVGAAPASVAFSPDGSRAFVSNLLGGNLSVIDTRARAVVANFAALTGPNGIAVAPNGRYLYVADQYSGAVTVHDTASGAIVNTISGFSAPTAIAITPSGNRVFVVDTNAGSVGVIDTASNSWIATIGVGSLPLSIAISRDGTRAYVANEYSFSLSVIDTSADALVGTFSRVGVYPVAVAMMPAATSAPPPAPVLASVSVNPNSITGGQSVSGTVTLTVAAGSSGATVSLSSSSGLAGVPATVFVGAGANAASFSVTTGAVSASAYVNVTASYGGATLSSGLTLMPAPVSSSSRVSFAGQNSGTQGNWKSAYGASGYNVLGDAAAYPGFAAVTPSGQSFWTWAGSSSDARALQKSAASDRVAATWYSGSAFTIDVNLTDGLSHQVAIYCVDWDSMGRGQTIEVLDAGTGAVMDSRGMAGFANGQYLTWNIQGHVSFRFTRTAGANAVVSGIFFDGAAAAAGAAAQFVKADSTTMGNWKGPYGANGYNVLGDMAWYPAYVSVTASGQAFWTWAGSSYDVRAPQKSASSDRVAATWYSGSVFSVDLNLTDGRTHQVAVYCVDWDSLGRAQTVDVLDAGTGAVLDSRSIAGFANGEYLVWNVSGHVTLRFTRTAGGNAVVSGIFIN